MSNPCIPRALEEEEAVSELSERLHLLRVAAVHLRGVEPACQLVHLQKESSITLSLLTQGGAKGPLAEEARKERGGKLSPLLPHSIGS